MKIGRTDWQALVANHLFSMGCDRAAQTKIIEEHRTEGTMDQINSQWKKWCAYVACQPGEVFLAGTGTSLDQLREDRQQVRTPTIQGDWLGWPTGPHIKTVHLVNFLSGLTSSNTDEEVAFSTFRSYKAHLLEILLKSGSLLDYYADPMTKTLLDSLTRDKQKAAPDKARYNTPFFEMDVLFVWLKSDMGRSDTSKKIKTRRERTATIVRMHSLARSDDLSKIKIGSLTRGRECQDQSSSHWIFDDRDDPAKVTGVALYVPEAKTDSAMILLGATPEEPELCPIRELQRHCEWLKGIPADEILDDTLFLTAIPMLVPGTQSKKYKSLLPTTIAGDVLNTMKNAGIDTEKWKAHSLRGAAATRLFDQGATLEMICELGRWAQASTFEKYYKRHKRPSTFGAGSLLVRDTNPSLHQGAQLNTDADQLDWGVTAEVDDMKAHQVSHEEVCGDSAWKTHTNRTGLNTSKPIPEAVEGGNQNLYHCWACNKKDARMIHCINCNKHLHRSHFGDTKSEHELAETTFLHEGWTCKECEDDTAVYTSWSSYNIRTFDDKKKNELRKQKLWHVGSLSKNQKVILEKIMK